MVEAPKTTEQPVPAVYKTVQVRKVVTPSKERRIPVAEEYQTVEERVKVADSRLEWRPILCETNTTAGVIGKLQGALSKAGYNPGPIDGVIGDSTMSAVNAFQRANGLASGQLTMETLRRLKVL
jgi:hypothetical protein